jgi:transcriptional regulator with XRE-family HTH domain
LSNGFLTACESWPNPALRGKREDGLCGRPYTSYAQAADETSSFSQFFPTLRILLNCYIDHTVNKTAMTQHKHQNQNRLFMYRRRMGFSQKHVAALLGFTGTSMLSRYEHGRSLPPLKVALALAIVLRVPVEFLFGGLFDGLRDRIRASEEEIAKPTQQTLFERSSVTSNDHARHS